MRASFVAFVLVVAVLAGVAAAGPILDTGKKLYSQNDEELIVRDFFNDRKDGFFVDVGSFHPQFTSTTYYLEKHLGWSGIAIDAQKLFAAQYKTLRPRTKFFNYIVTDHSGTTETLFLDGPVSSTDPKWREQFDQIKKSKPKPVEIPTMTLNELLEQNGVKHIDFLSMDIEGGETKALKAFDIEKYKPELIGIETIVAQRDAIARYFEAHDYERIDAYLKRDPLNWYYKPKAAKAAKDGEPSAAKAAKEEAPTAAKAAKNEAPAAAKAARNETPGASKAPKDGAPSAPKATAK